MDVFDWSKEPVVGENGVTWFHKIVDLWTYTPQNNLQSDEHLRRPRVLRASEQALFWAGDSKNVRKSEKRAFDWDDEISAQLLWVNHHVPE